MDDRTSYFVVSPDETRGWGSGPSSHIPTFGAATTAIDQYRVAGIEATNLSDVGAAFTDIAAIAALSKVAEGGLSSSAELAAAETALQAILLHDVAHVVLHAPKVDYGNGLVSYRRWDQNARSELGFRLSTLTNGRDFLIAPEIVRVEDGVVRSATFKDSPLIDAPIDGLAPGFSYWNSTIADAVIASVAQHGIPAYLADPRLGQLQTRNGFAKTFYHRLNVSWSKAAEDMPSVVALFGLPPLLGIVLDRLDNRQDLEAVLTALREELAPVRAELRELNSVLTAAVSQQEVTRRVRYITESFDAIMAEASLSGAERIQRRFGLMQRISRPIIKFMAGFVTKTGPSLNDMLRAASTPTLLVESSAVVERTTTAKTFAGLIRTEAVQSLIKQHLTPAEIASIEASLRT